MDVDRVEHLSNCIIVLIIVLAWVMTIVNSLPERPHAGTSWHWTLCSPGHPHGLTRHHGTNSLQTLQIVCHQDNDLLYWGDFLHPLSIKIKNSASWLTLCFWTKRKRESSKLNIILRKEFLKIFRLIHYNLSGVSSVWSYIGAHSPPAVIGWFTPTARLSLSGAMLSSVPPEPESAISVLQISSSSTLVNTSSPIVELVTTLSPTIAISFEGNNQYKLLGGEKFTRCFSLMQLFDMIQRHVFYRSFSAALLLCLHKSNLIDPWLLFPPRPRQDHPQVRMNSCCQDIVHAESLPHANIKTEEYLNCSHDKTPEYITDNKVVTTRTVSVPPALDPAALFYDQQKQLCLDFYRPYHQR